MDTLCNELKVEIFKYTQTPISLALINHNWYSTSQDYYARAEWLVQKYGKAQALFHAVRLGNAFITTELVQILFARKVVVSRYFVQRLKMQFGMNDPKLFEMKMSYSMNVETPLKNPWASGISFAVFTKLMNEASRELDDIALKGNDMELFHYLTAGPLAIAHAPYVFSENFEKIEDLILNKKFIPFPPRKTTPPTEHHYPSPDGYENVKQANLISRAILVYPKLVNMWKKIGYNEICTDLNELVMKGFLLVSYPPTPPDGWICPSSDTVAEKLKILIDLGFELTDNAINESIRSFESRMKIIGESMMGSFYKIRGESTPEIVTTILKEIKKTEKKKRRKRRKA